MTSNHPHLIPYKKTDTWELNLHIFHPSEGANSCKSGIIFFFGGGWTNGSAAHFMPQAQRLSELGMVAACADYRIFSKHGTTPFDAVADAKSAVRWMRENAEKLGIEPGRIAAGGGSAGGHLAASTAIIPGFEEPGVSSRPDALVLFNPVLDTTEKGYGMEKVTTARKTEISPLHHVRPGLPPTLVMHGDADLIAPYSQAAEFVLAMNKFSNKCRLITYPGRNHGFFNRRETQNGVDEQDFLSTLGETEAFLREIDFLK